MAGSSSFRAIARSSARGNGQDAVLRNVGGGSLDRVQHQLDRRTPGIDHPAGEAAAGLLGEQERGIVRDATDLEPPVGVGPGPGGARPVTRLEDVRIRDRGPATIDDPSRDRAQPGRLHQDDVGHRRCHHPGRDAPSRSSRR